MRIGFLFNHDQVHQIAHSLPVALALMPLVDVVLAATSERLAAEIVRLASAAGTPNVEIVQLRLSSAASRIFGGTLDGLLPARKLLVYRDNLDFFAALDALVVTERTSLLLKTRYGLADLPIILADHGAGDRAIGFGKETARFDLVLAAGAKIRDRLVRDAGVDPSRIAITGYPKFDLPGGTLPGLRFSGNGRPTVLYNPHVSPHLSSWFKFGRDVLEFFHASDRYNLIFAPHAMLFERRWALSIDRLRAAQPGRIGNKYHANPRIHIDLGSPASADMTYTNIADIYLGDVSSQIYEFLRQPRPAAFLNAHGASYADNPDYAHWRAGPVIDDIRDLGAALDAATADHPTRYLPAQIELFDYTFDLGRQPAGLRAACAILGYLGRRR